MPGSLIKLDEKIVTSAVSSTFLQGIDTTYDVYVVTVNNLKVTTDNTSCHIRVGNSGTADSSANYDYAYKVLDASTTFGNSSSTNQAQFGGLANLDNLAGANANAVFYLFNWANNSEYSFITQEISRLVFTGVLYGHQGGGVHTVTQSNSEIHFVMNSSTIASAEFTLYGLAK